MQEEIQFFDPIANRMPNILLSIFVLDIIFGTFYYFFLVKKLSNIMASYFSLNFNLQDYGQLLDHIRDIILATDLSHHLRIMPKLEELSHRGYDGTKSEDHYLLLCLLMTSADLSDQTKSWNNTVYVAKLIYEEFFQQGDMEKSLGHNPVDSMDRERACVPHLQISFLDYIITPLYK